jgi:hypothetical protein
MWLAIRATPTSSKAMSAKVAGSVALTSKSRFLKTRVREG